MILPDMLDIHNTMRVHNASGLKVNCGLESVTASMHADSIQTSILSYMLSQCQHIAQ